jgi:nudix-type nucleoside diphosphatase (YffH/AdpP family)
MKAAERARIVDEKVLADDWARLTKYTIDFTRRDGSVERQVRQVYDRGNGAGILPIDRARGTVLLVKQFRMPVYVNPAEGSAERGMLIEVCAGRLDQNDPETAIRKEAEEELGYRLQGVRRVFDTYMSPGSVSERLSLFVADYSPVDRVSSGGGAIDEGEDIEVLEMKLDEAIRLIDRNVIVDGKTIMLLQHVRLREVR